MKVFVQRVLGSTSIESKIAGIAETVHDRFVGPGLVALLGWTVADAGRSDLLAVEEWLRSRVEGLRIFPDSAGRMNLSLADYCESQNLNGGILWVPQFTLAGILDSGFRPSFTDAMAPELARLRYESWIAKKTSIGRCAQINGHFGADMNLTFTNWGPLSLLLEK